MISIAVTISRKDYLRVSVGSTGLSLRVKPRLDPLVGAQHAAS